MLLLCCSARLQLQLQGTNHTGLVLSDAAIGLTCMHAGAHHDHSCNPEDSAALKGYLSQTSSREAPETLNTRPDLCKRSVLLHVIWVLLWSCDHVSSRYS